MKNKETLATLHRLGFDVAEKGNAWQALLDKYGAQFIWKTTAKLGKSPQQITVGEILKKVTVTKEPPKKIELNEQKVLQALRYDTKLGTRQLAEKLGMKEHSYSTVLQVGRTLTKLCKKGVAECSDDHRKGHRVFRRLKNART